MNKPAYMKQIIDKQNADGMPVKETAWMYCLECDKFNAGEHPERPCIGTAFNFVIKDGKPPCNNYAFDNELLKE